MSRRPGPSVLTRDMLRAGGIERLIAQSVPKLRVLTEDERRASLAGLLGHRPEAGAGAWVFAYGSLIWNPAMHYVERRFARVYGWHRAFCLSTIAGRGSPELPGLVLGLDHGGACTGAAFRIAEEALAEELPLLWRREMLSGSYRPRWVAVRDEAGAVFGHAIAFTIRRGGTYYAGGLEEDEIVRRLAQARGALGSSAEYLFHTRDGLRSLGIVDRRIERLAAKVEHRLTRPEPGPGQAEMVTTN
ncbi:MAG: gamma-glutamylcyclotransferase [Acetobacteraceae bacterium]|nr:gamma-glutamylcyclotransferase [Acetobacteraceae bacterium]